MMKFENEINTYKTRVDNELKAYLEQYDALDEIKEAISYSLLNGGKRLRPIIMLKTAKMLHIAEERVMPMACALEMIHTYSLIHDDLPALDNDTLRRGKPTSHVVYGEANAILVGDSLLNLAIETALDALPEDMPAHYAHAVKFLFKCSGIGGMIGGQWLDLKYTGHFQTQDALKNMHMKKTGALFLAACLCPALSMGMQDRRYTALEAYAAEFGLLFQITDDILDVTGQEELLGKSIGKDSNSQKSTYVSIMGLESANGLARTAAKNAKKSLAEFGKGAKFHIALVDFVLRRNN